MKSPLKPSDLGRERRKAFPRAHLAAWTPDARRHTALDLLHAAGKDRVPALAALKYERMAASPFGFFRGAAPVMAYDLSLLPNTGILTQLCGDAHVQNLGAYTSSDGSLTFDINDFDETIRGPFEWDVKRLATSILLAGTGARIAPKACTQAAHAFLGSYAALMGRLAHMPVLEAARFQVQRLGRVNTISRIFAAAARSTPKRTLAHLTEPTKHGRRFRSAPPLLRRVTGPEAQGVLSALPSYIQTLLPERQHFFAQFRPLDVAFKVVGTGSVGLRDYCVYLEGNGPKDALFLQIKQESASVYAPYLPVPPTPEPHNGQRVADGQRAMQLQSDPLLGWTTLDSRDYLVRQLNDHKASLDITSITQSGLLHYAQVCGEMLARGHGRSGDARLLASYIGRGPRFAAPILQFAHSYAEQTEHDWKLLVKSRKKTSV